MALPTLPHDKANHFVYGAVLASIGSTLHSAIAGLALCIAFAIGKELRDLLSGRGTPDPLDAAATVFGGVVVYIPQAPWWGQP